MTEFQAYSISTGFPFFTYFLHQLPHSPIASPHQFASMSVLFFFLWIFYIPFEDSDPSSYITQKRRKFSITWQSLSLIALVLTISESCFLSC